MLGRLLVVWFLFATAGSALGYDGSRPLVVGSEENFPPFSLGTTADNAGGFTVDLWKAVANETGLKHTLRVAPWGEILQEFRHGNIQVLINIAQSDERRRYTDFSVPHVTVTGAVFVRKGDSRIRSEADLAGKSIIVFKSDLAHEYALSRGWQRQLVVVNNAEEGLRLLAAGKHDAMLLSRLAGLQTLKALNIGNVTVGATAGYAQKFSFGVRKGDAELLERLNEGLALTKANGTYDALYHKWFGIYETKEPTLRDMLQYLVPFAVMVLCIGSYFLYRRNIERRQAEEALAESKQRLDTILDNVGGYIFIKDTSYRYTYANRMVCELFGRPLPEIVGKDDSAFFSADSLDEIVRNDRLVIEHGETIRKEESDLKVGSDIRRTYWTVKIPLRNDGGDITGLCGISTDITELKRAEQKLQQSNSFNKSIIDSSSDCIKLLDLEGRLVFMSPGGQGLLGIKNMDDILNISYENFWKGDDHTAAIQAIERARQGDRGSFEGYCPTMDGTPRWWEVIITPVNGPDGKPEKLLAVSRDITERRAMEEDLLRQATLLEKELAERQAAQESLQEQTALLEEEIEERRRAEEALLQSEATIRNKLKVIMEPEGDIGSLELSDIIDCDMLRVMLEEFYKLTGILGAVLDISGKVLVAVGWQDICTKFHRCHPETLRNCLESDTLLTSGVPFGTFRRYRCKNHLWDMVTPIEVGGRHVGNVFIGQFFFEDEVPDVELFREQARRYGFDEKAYLAALERVPRFSRERADAGMHFYARLTEMISSLSFSSIRISRVLAERIHLEEQLRQSQKMEAVGQLAGGIAHDFNNVLQVISGYGSLLQMDDSLGAQQREELEQILSATRKATQLTAGLLAFSRKQVLDPAPVNLNELIENFRKFLVRIIGEDIQLRTTTCESGIRIYADAGQIEQVLINLATNARDAMPKGGTLTIEIDLQGVETPIDHEFGRAEQGLYAVITVSDTGCGMTAETCKRIFEPFYTTKEVGKGTGLGMSIVYGVIKQHGGFINICSESGHGTTIRIYLPVYEEPPPEQEEKGVAVAAPPAGGTEAILLAEDDADVRRLVVTVLAKYGYDVIQAVDGQDAVEKFSAHRDRVAMILMDMIMPRKNGKEAYEEICRLQPGVKVLYSSGYTADFIQNRGVAEDEVDLIMKPVQPMELLRKVREMLDR